MCFYTNFIIRTFINYITSYLTEDGRRMSLLLVLEDNQAVEMYKANKDTYILIIMCMYYLDLLHHLCL